MSPSMRRAISRVAAAAIVVIIIIAAAAAYFLFVAPPGPPPTTSPSPSPTTSPTTTPPTSPTTTTPPTTPPTTTTPSPTPIPKAIHQRVIYVINDDAVARINLYQTGTVDTAYIPHERLQDVEGITLNGFTSIVEKGEVQPIQLFIVLNTQREPLNNVLVRQALAWAVPYDQIIEVVYAGRLARNYACIPKGWPGDTEFGITKYDYDLSKAQQLLQEAGIDPTQYSIEVIYNAGNTARERIATLLQNTWGQLGFQVSIGSYEWPVYLSKTEHGDFDAYIVGWVPDYLDSDNWAGPFLYGATEFSVIEVHPDVSSADIANLLATATVIETDTSVIVVGEKGTGATAEIPSGKKIIVVAYTVDEAATPSVEELMEAGQGFGAINPAFLRDTIVDALVVAARRYTDPTVRTELFKAIQIKSNELVPEIILGQYILTRVYWDWLKGRYYHPTFPERFDLLWEDPEAPAQPIGIKDYQNNPNTYAIATIGWPESFDPAMTYETFGWGIWHQIGDTLVTYWRTETEEVTPDLAVAWAHNEDGTEWYFVIRGGVVAYDPWNDKTYSIDAIDVLFSFWRVERLGHSVSWMVSSFMDVNGSKAYTETEFDQILQGSPLIAEYKGQTSTVSSLSELLDFFGYTGDTAGVFFLKLPAPYAAILGIVADPFLSVLPMEYLLGDQYEAALEASDHGKNPEAWTEFLEWGVGDEDPTHRLMHQYPVGTGAYYVADYEENSYIVLELNPYYWNATLWEELYGYTPSTSYTSSDDTVILLSVTVPIIAILLVAPITRRW